VASLSIPGMGRPAVTAVLVVLLVLAFKDGWHGYLFGLACVATWVVFMIAGQPARRRKRELEAVAEQRRRDLEYAQAGLAEVDVMHGVGFEQYVAAKLRTAGWEVTATPATNDYGVDLVAINGKESWAIQCKRKSTPVGVSAVQQVVAGAIHYGCWRKMVVSNQEFTRQAKVLALAHDCDLVGRSLLPSWRLEPPLAQEHEPTPVLVRDETLLRRRPGAR
jgi:restriction system protein